MIETERLQLRPFSLADVDDVYEYASDDEFAKFLNHPKPSSVEDARQFLRAAVGGEMGRNLFAISLIGDGRAIGAVQLESEGPQRASLHYELTRKWWGKGLASEAVVALLDWGLESDPSIQSVEASTSAANSRSRQLLERLGFCAVESNKGEVRYEATRSQLQSRGA